jgi:hypothetical protein
MIPPPVCPINTAWISIVISVVALAVSVLGWFVNDLLARRRETILAEDGKRREAESRKRDFIICIDQQRIRLNEILRFDPRQDEFQKFHAQSRLQIEDAVCILKPSLTDSEAARLDILRKEYGETPQDELDAKFEDGWEADFERTFAEKKPPQKPSERLLHFLDEFEHIAK